MSNVISFPRAADPSKGEVYATPFTTTRYDGGTEIETNGGFAVVHMSAGGDSASIESGYDTLTDAQGAARMKAARLGAVLS